jgi:DNA-binding transcriptional LysR family regulator
MSYLEAIDVHGTMRGAAESLDVNVSTVSRQIASMQRELQLALVSRQGRAVTLTEAGHAVVDYFRECERNARRFRSQLDEYRGLRRGRLMLGITEGFVNDFVVGVLKRFNAQFPQITVELCSAILPDMMRMLRDDEVDICLIAGIEKDPSLVMRRLHSEPLCAIVSVSHPLAQLETVSPAQLAGDNLVFMPDTFAVQRYIQAIFHDMHPMPMPRFRCDRFATALTMAAEGLGVAFMTRRAAARQIANGEVRAVPIDHPIARSMDRFIVMRAGRRLPPAGNFLWKEIVRVMSSV